MMSPCQRQQVVLAHKILIVLESTYVIGSLLMMTLVPSHTSAPLLSASLLVALHGVALVVGVQRTCSDWLYATSTAVVVVMSAACIALCHSRISQHVLAITGECGLVADCVPGEADYRTDGQLVLQWLLCFQTLFLLTARSVVVAPPLSIFLYQGVTMAAGAPFDHIDFAMVAVPVCLCVVAKVISEGAWQGCVEAWKWREPEQGARTEEEIAVPQHAADHCEGSVKEDNASSSSFFNLSRTNSWGSQGQPSSEFKYQRPLRQQRQQRQQQARILCHAEVGVQTTHGLASSGTCEGCSQTEIVWDREGFRCTRCSRPPRAPVRPGEELQLHLTHQVGSAVPQPPAPVAPRSPSRRRASRRRGSRTPTTQLRFPGVPRTPRTTQAQTFLMSCFAWNEKMPVDRCCDLHGLIDHAVTLGERLKSLSCDGGDGDGLVSRCSVCGACSTDSNDVGTTCEWCDEGIMMRTSGDAPEVDFSCSDSSPDSNSSEDVGQRATL